MSYRVAINGYGRIGQCVLRALYENGYREKIQVVAINELSDIDTIAYLTRYDSTHGRFSGSVNVNEGRLCIKSGSRYSNAEYDKDAHHDHIEVISQKSPEKLPWKALNVDLVLECTGAFGDRDGAEAHITAGAGKVLFSQPADANVDKTIVYGINHESLSSADRIVSNASCTTNCIAPAIKVIQENLGIKHGTITTLHDITNTQVLVDAPHKDLRRARSAINSLIPTSTGSATAITMIYPELKGKLNGLAVRIPLLNASLTDCVFELNRETTEEEVNALLKTASEGELKGILGYEEKPLVSADYTNDRRSGIIDAQSTMVVDGTMLKLFVWYDNEMGYAARMMDLCQKVVKMGV